MYLYVRVHIKKYTENFAFLILRVLELFTLKVCEIFTYKHTETIKSLKSSLLFKKNLRESSFHKNATFSGFIFIRIGTNREVFKFALVYL